MRATRWGVVGLLLPAVGFAGEVERDELGREVRYEQRQVIEEDQWAGVNIDGGLQRPTVKMIAGRTVGAFNPLIRFRVEFARELKATVDQVK